MKAADIASPGTILVATNLEETSLLIHHAAIQARRTGARIILAHVVAPDPAEKKTSLGVARIADPELCHAQREKLDFTALQLQWQGILCDPVVLSGDPAEQIAAFARIKGADRVLIAGPKRTAHTTSKEGSFAERLLRNADIPLFVFGPHASLLPEADASDGRILLSLSLRHDRPDYVRFASRLSRETCSRLALLHVVTASGMSDRQKQQAHANARTRLAALAATETHPLFPIEILVREGDIAQSIVEEAMCPHRDLIVLGAGPLHHGGASRNGLLYQVIANARCPVVAVKPLRKAEPEKDLTPVLKGAAD